MRKIWTILFMLAAYPTSAFAQDEQTTLLKKAVETAGHAVSSVTDVTSSVPCAPSVPAAPSTPSVCTDPALAGADPIDLLKSSREQATVAFQSNLESARAAPARLAASASCVRAQYYLVWDKGRDPLFQRPNGVYAADEFLRVLRDRPTVSATLLKQLKALREKMPDLDSALVLAIAFRESGSNILSTNGEAINSSKGGGLDFIGQYLPELRNNYVPAGYGRKWKGGRQEAFVPKNELVVAYGATYAMNRDMFHEAAKKSGFEDEQLQSMSPEARRVWEALFFAMPGGNSYKFFLKDKNWSGAGGRTLLEQLQARIKEGKGQGLNDILTLPEFNLYKNVQLAKVVAANASIIETLSGIR